MARAVPAVNPAQRTRSVARRRIASTGTIAAYVAMAAVTLLICLPLAWMALASLKTRQEIYSLPISWIPETYRWRNYADAWNAVPFGRYFLNSMIVTAGGASLKLVNAALTAYALVFLRFPKKNVIFLLVIAALMVPVQVTLIPNYVFVADRGWLNSYQGMILPTGGVALGTFLLRQHFQTLPREVIEAARIDGAGHLRLLWQIVLPMSRPALVAVGMIAVVTEWNDYLWPFLVANSADMRTLPVGLTALQNSEGSTEWGIVMAGTVMVITPVLLLFLWAQRHIVEGLTAGSVKG